MEFKRFSSIENSYREKFVDLCRMNIAPNEVWCATIKYHGANFSLWFNQSGFRAAKRSSFIDAKDLSSFYSCYDVVDKYTRRLHPSWRLIINDVRKLLKAPIESFAIYGELYGKGVQKEIDYGEKDFVAFSLVTFTKELGMHVENQKNLQLVCNYLGIPMAEIVGCGSLDYCLNIDVEKLKTKNGQVHEGIVIKPLEPHIFPNGKQAILKKKSKSFTEKSGRKQKAPTKPMSDLQKKYFDCLSQYVVDARLMNVVSKIGLSPVKDFGKILGLTIQDAVEDCIKDNEEFANIKNADRKRVHKLISPLVSSVIKINWDSVFSE